MHLSSGNETSFIIADTKVKEKLQQSFKNEVKLHWKLSLFKPLQLTKKQNRDTPITFLPKICISIFYKSLFNM